MPDLTQPPLRIRPGALTLHIPEPDSLGILWQGPVLEGRQTLAKRLAESTTSVVLQQTTTFFKNSFAFTPEKP